MALLDDADKLPICSPENIRRALESAHLGEQLAQRWADVAREMGATDIVMVAAVDLMFAALLVHVDGEIVPADTAGMLIGDDHRIELHIMAVKHYAEVLRANRPKKKGGN